MKKHVIEFSAAVVFLMVASTTVVATPYCYGWTQEYTGSEPGTVALWNFNATSTISGGHKSNVIGAGTNDWYAQTDDTTTTNTSHATFVAGGKWGGGLENIGQTTGGGYRYDSATVNGGTTAANLFPTGSDPNLSVECWVKFDTIGTYAEFLVDHRSTGTASTATGYQLSLSAARELKFSLGTGLADATIATNFIEATSAALLWTAGQWYHIAGTWDAATDTAKVYRDATVVATTIAAGKTIVNSTKPLAIGQRLTSNYGALDGVIDEVRISSVAYIYIISSLLTTYDDSGTVYLPGDISGPAGVRDCKVNFYDLRAMLLSWLDCTDPADPTCN